MSSKTYKLKVALIPVVVIIYSMMIIRIVEFFGRAELPVFLYGIVGIVFLWCSADLIGDVWEEQ